MCIQSFDTVAWASVTVMKFTTNGGVSSVYFTSLEINLPCTFMPYFFANHIAHSMIYWHDTVICLSVCNAVHCGCIIMIHPTVKVYDHVNRTCPLGTQFCNFQPSVLTLLPQTSDLMNRRRWRHLADTL